MSDDYGMGAWAALTRILFVTCCVSVPLGLWKLVEIVIWVARHLRWEWTP
jgi:hypothetical protein